jgi:ketosteroid isomerase-like protein
MSQPEKHELSQNDREKIDDVTRRFAERMLKGDVVGTARLYTPDAVLMPPNHPNVSGQSAISDYLGTFPKVARFSASNDEIDGCGDIAYVRGRYEMTLEPEGGEPFIDCGAYLEIRRRQDDGSWLIAADMFNSDVEA